MAHSNEITRLLNKISRRLQLGMLEPYLNKTPDFNRNKWYETICEDTLPEFSRNFPYEFKLKVSNETCDTKKDESGNLWYYIKEDVLQGVKLLGIQDIDWMDHSQFNSSLGRGVTMNYWPGANICPVEALNSVVSLQMNADLASLYNRGIYIDFKYPDRFRLVGFGNITYQLDRFVVTLLVEHSNLSTISPTKMSSFEKLAVADVANLLLGIKYIDGIQTAFADIDLRLDKISSEADKRDEIVKELEEARVSTANDNAPIIWTI